jgi:RNA polymerase sigma-70 factor (ECF subfamily)
LADDADRPGDRASVEAWVLSTLPRAVAFAASLLRDRSAADDVVQDSYCRLLAKAAVYDLPRDGTRILFKAISNACVDHARARRKRPLGAPPDDSDAPAAPEPADWTLPDPSDAAARRELDAALDAALARLPVSQRAAVELKALGYSLAEIAEAVGVTETNAGVLIHRGRRTLADHLTRFLDHTP